jgi:hypothetical protein
MPNYPWILTVNVLENRWKTRILNLIIAMMYLCFPQIITTGHFYKWPWCCGNSEWLLSSYHDQSPQHSLDRRMGEPQSRSGRGGWRKISCHSPCHIIEPRSSIPLVSTKLNYLTRLITRENFVKGKVVSVLLTEHHAIKAYWESGGITPLILWPRH